MIYLFFISHDKISFIEHSAVSYFLSSNAKRTIQSDNSFISYIIDPSYAIIREYLMIALNRSPSISISKFPPVAST